MGSQELIEQYGDRFCSGGLARTSRTARHHTVGICPNNVAMDRLYLDQRQGGSVQPHPRKHGREQIAEDCRRRDRRQAERRRRPAQAGPLHNKPKRAPVLF